jgi:hypothetical protein
MRLLLLLSSALLASCALVGPEPVPPGPGKAVVVDIDGTLTPDVTSIYEVRPDAVAALEAFKERGYQIVYASVREPIFQGRLRHWLFVENAFPRGPLHVGQTKEDRSDPATFKAKLLEAYVKAGWRLAYAYGDSESDFGAYQSAGVPPDHTFALKRRGADQCHAPAVVRCLGSWSENLPYIRSVDPAR